MHLKKNEIKFIEDDEMADEVLGYNGIQLDRTKIYIPISKHMEEKIIENISKKYESMLDSIWFYHYERTEEFFNELKQTIAIMAQEQRNKMIGIILLGLAFLVSVSTSVYLYVNKLPDAAKLFIYPSILSIIMLIFVITRKEGDSIAQKGS